MPLSDRLVHSLALIEPTLPDDPDDNDEYNQPVAGDPTVTLLRGFVYPLEARSGNLEQPQPDQAGETIADHAIVLHDRPIPPSGYLRYEPDDGVRYEITGQRHHSYGSSPLVEVLTRRVIPSAP